MVQHLEYLQFSVLIALVLEHLLYRYSLSSFSHHSLEHNPEGSVTDNLLCVVGK
jgi:hypothetical protein